MKLYEIASQDSRLFAESEFGPRSDLAVRTFGQRSDLSSKVFSPEAGGPRRISPNWERMSRAVASRSSILSRDTDHLEGQFRGGNE
jgi:hypothetical protein